MIAKKELQQKAKELRAKDGLSVREIARIIGASRSSVSLWVRGVVLSDPQKEELRKHNPASKDFYKKRSTIASSALSKKYKDLRIGYQESGRELSIQYNSDPLYVAGCMLYWAEGGKTQRNVFSFTNMDIEMHKFFLRFLRKFFNIQNKDICCHIRTHYLSDKTQDEIGSFWKTELGLDNLQNIYFSIEKRIPKQPRVNYGYGILQIRVNSTELVQTIFGSIKEFAGIKDNELWIG